MAYIEPCNFEFIDLSDVEEKERNQILSSLCTRDPNVILPWRNDPVKRKPAKKAIVTPSYIQEPSTIQYTHENNLSKSTDLDNGNIDHQSKVEKVENDNNTPVKSWASLFDNKQTVNDGTRRAKVENAINSVGNNTNGNRSMKLESLEHNGKYDDPNYYRMGEYLTDYEIDNRITSLKPKGLINRSNYCYINSILQALLACPPMYNLLNGLGKYVVTDKKRSTTFIDSMVRFVNEFEVLPDNQRIARRSDKKQKKDVITINCNTRGTPFEPNWIFKILNGMRSDTFVVEGLQEDAEEFLGCLLNGLNDEMVELIKLVDGIESGVGTNNGHESDTNCDKEWQVMGPKNKGCVTRRTEILKTPISTIFGGHLRSRIHRTGDQSTDSIQPFFTLPLNIEKFATVYEALEALVTKNQLEGVTSSKTNEEVEAWQQVTIEELPMVLILHLKCFDYKPDGCSKIIKQLEFPVDLKIDPKLLSSKTNYSSKEKQYKLFAVIYHDGKEATKGHYITDAYHVGYASWLRYDDAVVRNVQDDQVLKPSGTRVPYLLFYRRSVK